MNIRGRNKITPEFNMSSMTDIVFLLLIFFMIASTLAKTDTIDVKLPTANGKTENRKSVAVTIKKDLSVYIDKTKVTKSRLEARIKDALAASDSPTIVLRAEKSVPVDNVVHVMDIANRNRFKVVLAVSKK